MKNTMRYILFAVLAFSWTSYGVSVRDFGAVGDGKTDDTRAIQQAVSQLASRIKLMRVRVDGGWYSGNKEAPVEELFFPAGNYLVSRTIFADGSVAWRGEKGTRITMTDPEQDLLYCRVFRHSFFEFIEFCGGRTQLQMWSSNSEASSLHIRNCIFRDSAAPALRSISRQRLDPKSKKNHLVAPYEVVMENGLARLTPNSLEGTTEWYSSSNVFICSTGFLNCARAFEVDNDGTLLENCRIVANPKSPGPVMIAGVGPAPNMLCIWNLQAEAPASEVEQFWFRNNGFYLNCSDSSFRSAKPMLFMEQNTRPLFVNKNAGCVMVNRCTFNAAGNPQGALVAVHRVPNIFSWTDNRNESGEVPLFKWHVTPTEGYLLRDSFPGEYQGKPHFTKNKYNFVLNGNQGIAVNLPPILEQYRCGDAPLLHRKFPARNQEFEQPAQQLRAADFGVVGDGVTDNSQALAAALEAASLARKTLLLPSGKIRLASTVKLPEFTAMRGEGMPMIIGDGIDNYDLFEAENPEVVSWRSLLLFRGRKILTVKLGAKTRTISLQDCVIYDSSACSFALTGEKNECSFRASGTMWPGSGAIVTDCNYNEFVMCWLSNNFFMEDQAFLSVRRGSTLVLRSGFFTPYYGGRKKRINSVTGEVRPIRGMNNKLRWIDNAGADVYLSGCRGGGESGGFGILRQTAPGGTVYVESGYGNVYNPSSFNALFYADAAPDQLTVNGVVTTPGPMVAPGVIRARGLAAFPYALIGTLFAGEPPEK